MFAEVSYEAMRLKGDDVEGVWEDEGTIRIQVAAPREASGSRQLHTMAQTLRKYRPRSV